MTTDEQHHLVSFLTNCSPVSLGNFLLAKQNRAANLERHLRDLVQELCENLVFIELACLLRNNGRDVRTLEVGRGTPDLSTSPNAINPNWWRWTGDRDDLTKNEVWTLMGIKRYSNANGVAVNLSRRRIARWSRLSLRGVSYGLKGLRSKGFIETTFTGHGDRIQLLEPPPLMFSGVQPVHTSIAAGADLVSTGCTPQPPGVHRLHTLSVNRKNVPPVLPGRSNRNLNGNGEGRRLEREILIDDDKLTNSLYEKFKSDPKFPGLEKQHIVFGIVQVRERALTPPGSLKYWETAIEKFLLDFPGEIKHDSDKKLWKRLLDAYPPAAPIAAKPESKLAKKAGQS